MAVGVIVLALALALGVARAAVVPPSWADPRHNPCAAQPGGWQLLLWPADGRCYRIFRRGHPCPSSMELSPGVGPNGEPGCRCPPGTAQLHAAHWDDQCHPLLEQGPCPHGQYFAPLPATPSADRAPQLWGWCRAPDPCPAGQLFWARDGRCYPRLSRGPCYRGELLVGAAGSALGACRCEARGELARFYSPLTRTCHEHYTPGPCQERGQLFLPGGQCGCSKDLPHYHPDTGHCYQIDTIGPCPAGHRFTPPSGRGRALCQCKEGHVLWGPAKRSAGGGGDGGEACYRPWTRGPCPAGQLLANSSQCVEAPCRPGRLYFPEDGGCYKVGVRGPCPKGQVVLFETAVRPALEGISYRGVCGCSGPSARSSSNDITGKPTDDDTRCGSVEPQVQVQARDRGGPETQCDAKTGKVLLGGACYPLYSQGPCPHGQWVVPERRAREREGRSAGAAGTLRLWQDGPPPRTARCDCRPGHKPIAHNTTSLECQPPTVVLASFLNARGFTTS